jgi:hypothetical protein
MELNDDEILVVARVADDSRIRTRYAGNIESRLRDHASRPAGAARSARSNIAVGTQLELDRRRGAGGGEGVEERVQAWPAAVERVKVERGAAHVVHGVRVDRGIKRGRNVERNVVVDELPEIDET